MSTAYLTHQDASGRLVILRYSAGRRIIRPDLVSPASTAVEPGTRAGIPACPAPAMTMRLADSPSAEPPAPRAGVRGAGTTQGGN